MRVFLHKLCMARQYRRFASLLFFIKNSKKSLGTYTEFIYFEKVEECGSIKVLETFFTVWFALKLLPATRNKFTRDVFLLNKFAMCRVCFSRALYHSKLSYIDQSYWTRKSIFYSLGSCDQRLKYCSIRHCKALFFRAIYVPNPLVMSDVVKNVESD